ncbi:MAG: Intracellular septation protein [Acidimicrobiales bacterium]|nr:Intracellular septation protein [Acidimicrobiales bacterium]
MPSDGLRVETAPGPRAFIRLLTRARSVVPVGALAPSSTLPMLVPRPAEGSSQQHAPLQKRPIVEAVLRRGLPRVLEASIIPNLLFIVALALLNVAGAMVAVIVWTLSSVARRIVLRQAIPGVLILAVATLLARTALSLGTGSTVVYFLQPVITTVAIAVLLAGSIVVGRPFVKRLAGDFCPIGPDVTNRPAVERLFRHLTIVWTAVYVATASVTLVLLLTTPLGVFVAVKTVGCLAITVLGVVVTVWMSWATARREDLVFAVV